MVKNINLVQKNRFCNLMGKAQRKEAFSDIVSGMESPGMGGNHQLYAFWVCFMYQTRKGPRSQMCHNALGGRRRKPNTLPI